MPEDYNPLEEWTCVINKHVYKLNHKQSDVLRRAIARGEKGVIVFDKFIINIPMIQEFYFEKMYIDPKTTLAASNEVNESFLASREKVDEIRIKLNNVFSVKSAFLKKSILSPEKRH